MTIAPVKLGALSLMLSAHSAPQSSTAFTPTVPPAQRSQSLLTTQSLKKVDNLPTRRHIDKIQAAKKLVSTSRLYQSLEGGDPDNSMSRNETRQHLTEDFSEFDSTNKRSILYERDWQKIRDNPDLHSLMNMTKSGLFYLDKNTIKSIFQGVDNSSLLIRTFYNGVDYVDITANQQKLLHAIIDLAQLSGARLEVPHAVVIVSPELKKDVITEKLKRSVKGEFVNAITENLYFNQTDQPQVVAVDISSTIVKAVRDKITVMQQSPNDCGIVSWFGHFHKAVKRYYDQIENTAKISPLSWQLYGMLYKAYVIESIAKDLPRYFKTQLPEDKTLNEIVFGSIVSHLNALKTDWTSSEEYIEKVLQSHQWTLENQSSEAAFDSAQPVFIQYDSSVFLSIDQDAMISAVQDFLGQQFPNTYSESEQAKLLDHVPLGANNQTLLPYRYPLKHLLRAEAEFLLMLLSINTNIQNHAKCFTAVNKIGGIKNQKKESQLLIDAMTQHYHTLMTEEIRSVIGARNTASALIQHEKFNAFMQDWVSIYTEEVAASMADYQGKRDVLLDRYFPVSSARRI